MPKTEARIPCIYDSVPLGVFSDLARGLAASRTFTPFTASEVEAGGYVWSALCTPQGVRVLRSTLDVPMTVGEMLAAPLVPLDKLHPSHRNAICIGLATWAVRRLSLRLPVAVA
jgi:hypothetical protein